MNLKNKSPMKKVALFGSSFDPPHFAHAAMILHARELVDEVWLSVSLPRWDKTQELSFPKRLQLAKLFTQELQKIDPHISITLEELYFQEFRGTHYFLEHLRLKFPHILFYFILGADSLEYIHLWRDPVINEINGHLLLEKTPIIAFPRTGNHISITHKNILLQPTLENLEKKYNSLFQTNSFASLSSSFIRKNKDKSLFYCFKNIQTCYQSFFK